MNESSFTIARQQMVAVIAAYAKLAGEQIGRDAFDPRVLEVMAKMPRHEFVPAEVKPYAYENLPLPIGFGKTISQPFIVALMTDLLDPQLDDQVLEIGTGLGYQTAILAELAAHVWTVEIVEELATEAEKRLKRRACDNVTVRIGNGANGWAEKAPFDKIMVTAAPELIPPPLIQQLKPGGRMVLPTGVADAQQLVVVDKDASGRVRTREVLPVRFTPLETVV
jgi:protein-L-isoaspartate(D-aspartate) O-methyltransferase